MVWISQYLVFCCEFMIQATKHSGKEIDFYLARCTLGSFKFPIRLFRSVVKSQSGGCLSLPASILYGIWPITKRGRKGRKRSIEMSVCARESAK